MADIFPIKNNFSAGEIGPLLYDRSDMDAFRNGAEKLLNVVALPQGGLTRRGGFHVIHWPPSVNVNYIALIDWVFSEAPGEAFVLECGYDDGGIGSYLRVHSVENHAYTGVELSSDAGDVLQWEDADIPNLRYVQKNDVMWITDGVHPVLKLTRSGTTAPGTWTVEVADFWGDPLELTNTLEYTVYAMDWNYVSAWLSLQDATPNKTSFNHIFTTNKTISVGSIWQLRTGMHSSDLEYGPFAFGYVSNPYNPNKPDYFIFPYSTTTFYSLRITGRIYISVSGTYVFGINGAHACDCIVGGVSVANWYQVHTEGANPQNYTEFIHNGTIDLAVGEYAFVARVYKNSLYENWGLTIGYRKELEEEEKGTGSWDGFGITRHDWGNTLYKYKIQIVANGATADQFTAYYWDSGTSSWVSTGYENVDITGLDQAFETDSGYCRLQFTAKTGHTIGHNWIFQEGLEIIPYAPFQQTMYTESTSYPRVLCMHGSRLMLGGMPAKPNRYIASCLGDTQLENFQIGTNDDDAFEVAVASRQNDAIMWMISSRRLLIGTGAAEYAVGSSERSLTPSHYPTYLVSNNGSVFLQPVVSEMGNVYYVEKSGKRLREFVWTEDLGYKARDISIMSAHLCADGISQLAYQQAGVISPNSGPVNVLWAITGAGNLVGLTLEAEHEVYAWHQHNFADTDETFKAICTVPGADGSDELWAVVTYGAQDWLVYLKYDQIYDYLVGTPVQFVSEIIPTPFEIGEQRRETALRLKKRWVEIVLYLLNTESNATTGLKISRGTSDIYASMKTALLSDVSSTPEERKIMMLGWDRKAQFKLATKERFTLLGVKGKVEVNE